MKNIVICLITSFALLACKTPVTGMQQHDSFTYAALSQQQFIIGGVVSSVQPMEDSARIRYGDLLAREFYDEKPEMRFVRAGFLLKQIGAESFARLLDDYKMTGVFGVEDVNDVRYAFPDARYLVVSRIEQDLVRYHHNETETDVADSEEDRREGEFEHVRVDVSLSATREMGASLLIYDLKDNVVAWSGYVRDSETNSNDTSRTFNKDNRWTEELVDAFVDSLTGVDADTYPEPPMQEDVLSDIFEGFAENMPEQEK